MSIAMTRIRTGRFRVLGRTDDVVLIFGCLAKVKYHFPAAGRSYIPVCRPDCRIESFWFLEVPFWPISAFAGSIIVGRGV